MGLSCVLDDVHIYSYFEYFYVCNIIDINCTQFIIESLSTYYVYILYIGFFTPE